MNCRIWFRYGRPFPQLTTNDVPRFHEVIDRVCVDESLRGQVTLNEVYHSVALLIQRRVLSLRIENRMKIKIVITPSL